jgi:hypothetical protein
LPAQILDFSDYHRTVIGFHGTDMASAERLVAGEDFEPSDEDDEWFGKGIYFWEHAFKQAWWWARRHKRHKHPSVIGAVIRLGNCFDLIDPGNVDVLRDFYEAMVGEMDAAGIEKPLNVHTQRRLDCALFNYVYGWCEQAQQPLDTARAVYIPTSPVKRVIPGSWISEETHIQVGVRNPRSILAIWHVREDGRYGKQAVPSE